jgi:hypothetical protein
MAFSTDLNGIVRGLTGRVREKPATKFAYEKQDRPACFTPRPKTRFPKVPERAFVILSNTALGIQVGNLYF